MQFAPIPPLELLSQVLINRKLWFALPYKSYKGTYLCENRPKDVTLMLDNGAYEEQLVVEGYRNIIYALNPQIAVLPDLLLGPWKRSMQSSLGFLETVSFPKVEWMYVPQAEPGDLHGWTESLLWGANDERVSWIGLPRCLCTHITQNSLARVFWADYIREKFPRLKVHALGMMNGNVHELPFLAERGVVSIDSSCPFNAENIGHWQDKLKEIDDICLNTALPSVV